METRSGDDSRPKPRLKRRHVAAVTIGNALEFYDFLIYGFFSIQIGHAFFPAQSAYGSLMLSLATFGAGFVTRPIGALVIGAYSDRVGRRPAMMLCFILIGVSIVAMALTPSYAQIGIAAPILAVIARMVQGFSLGGEVGSNTAYLMEAATPARRGLVVSWQRASQLMALIAGGLVGAGLTSVLPAEALDAYGWRIAFLLGIVSVPFGLWLRSTLPETLHDPDGGAVATATPQPRLAQARAHWRVFAIAVAVLAAGTISSYTMNYIVTYAQATLHMEARLGFIASTIGYACGVPTILLGGWLSDRYGRKPINIWGLVAFLAVIYPVFTWIAAERSTFALITGVVILNVVGNFSMGAFYAGLAESLPKTIRGAGFGTIYSATVATFGGTTQLVVTWLIHVTGSALAPAYYLTGATVIGLLALLAMPESAPTVVSRKPTKAHVNAPA
jgi:MFS family permease